MIQPIILASGSDIRASLLRQAAVPFEISPARIDEEAIKEALVAEDAAPRDIADALAEAKARKVSLRAPGGMTLGCDQVLAFDQKIYGKPKSPDDCISQLKALRGQKHQLLSAAVIYEDGKPVWRHVGQVRLWMRDASDGWIEDYVARNWESLQWSVGGYKIEEEGVRLFTRIEGDYFNILGLPLLELLSYLTLRGNLPS